MFVDPAGRNVDLQRDWQHTSGSLVAGCFFNCSRSDRRVMAQRTMRATRVQKIYMREYSSCDFGAEKMRKKATAMRATLGWRVIQVKNPENGRRPFSLVLVRSAGYESAASSAIEGGYAHQLETAEYPRENSNPPDAAKQV